LAHRAVLFAELGHHDSARTDALIAGALARQHGFGRERVVAMLGEVIARWHSTLDTTVLTLIHEVKMLAHDLDLDGLHRLTEVEVEVLWSMGRYDDARSALQRDIARLQSKLHCQTADPWQNVRAGVDRLRQASAGEADALTGLPNRQFLGRWLPEVLANDVPVCIGALNIDVFRNVNEQFGYEAGDRVLQEVAEVLEHVCRRGDSVVRTNGDEFVMVLRDASPGDGRIVFERIRQLIAARSWSSLPLDEHLTASVGVTVGSGAMNSNTLLATANDALRQAKLAGRDRISFR
jgi:diguanylate cyclase (GGDEF)-like protein